MLYHRILCAFSLLPALLSAAEHRASANVPAQHEALFNSTGSDWKEAWEKRGITVTSSYEMDLLGNPFGGKRQGFAHAGSYGIDFIAHLDRICGWKGWKAHMGWTWRTGSNLSKTIGNQFPVAQLYGGETWRLNVLYLMKSFYNGNMLVKFGRLEGGDDFLQSPLYCNFVSNAFCGNPIGIFFNTFFTAYPNATWGAYWHWKLQKRILWKVALYNANADVNLNQYNGFNFQFKNTQGVQWITEVTYLLNQEECDRGLPGNYKAAIYYYTGSYNKFLGGSTRGNYGYYFLVDQMVYRIEGERGITPFVALLFAPEDRNLFPFFFSSGIVFKGLSAARPHDASALGAAYGSYSSDLRRSQQLSGERRQNFEMVLEANHTFQINKNFFVQPDLQYIIKPKGYSNIPNALVVGAQVGITF